MQNDNKTSRTHVDTTVTRSHRIGSERGGVEPTRQRVNTTKLLHYEIDADLAAAFVAA